MGHRSHGPGEPAALAYAPPPDPVRSCPLAQPPCRPPSQVLLAAPLTRNRIVHHRSVLLAALVVAAQVYVVAGALPRHPHSDGDDDRPLFDTTPWVSA